MNEHLKRAKLEPDAAGQVDDKPYVLEEQIGHLLRRAHQRASALFMEKIGEARFTPTQYAALIKIHDLGEVSQNRLGRLTAMDPATIKGVVERLRKRDLVTSRRDPTNRRRVVLTLTATGARLAEQVIPRGKATSEATLAPLGKTEQKRLIALLRRLT